VEWVEPWRWTSNEVITADKLNTARNAILWLKENLGGGWREIVKVERTDWETDPVEVPLDPTTYSRFAVEMDVVIRPPAEEPGYLKLEVENNEGVEMRYHTFGGWDIAGTKGLEFSASTEPFLRLGATFFRLDTENRARYEWYVAGGQGDHRLAMRSSDDTCKALSLGLWWVSLASSTFSKGWIKPEPAGASWKGWVLITGMR